MYHIYNIFFDALKKVNSFNGKAWGLDEFFHSFSSEDWIPNLVLHQFFTMIENLVFFSVHLAVVVVVVVVVAAAAAAAVCCVWTCQDF